MTYGEFTIQYPDERLPPVRSIQLVRTVRDSTPSILKLNLPHPMHDSAEVNGWRYADGLEDWQPVIVSEDKILETNDEALLS